MTTFLQPFGVHVKTAHLAVSTVDIENWVNLKSDDESFSWSRIPTENYTDAIRQFVNSFDAFQQKFPGIILAGNVKVGIVLNLNWAIFPFTGKR